MIHLHRSGELRRAAFLGGTTTLPLMISEGTVDDLMNRAVSSILDHGIAISPTKGEALDLNGITLELTDPRARLSRSATRGVLFSSMGELCWYLSGSNALEPIAYYISHYSELGEAGKVHGGYGPRLFGPDGRGQIHTVIDMLRHKPDSRRAVVSVFERGDLQGEHLDVPCTCVLQFLIRRERLHLMTYMRSNDVYLGLPHDIFAFTMLQELVASSLGVPIGTYVHMVGSLHLYSSDREKAKTFLNEGWQSTIIEMPEMPEGDPWPMVRVLLEAERALRLGVDPLSVVLPDDAYWADLIRVLQVFSLYKQERALAVPMVSDNFNSPAYRLFIADKVT
jgi:thymidylate synthase